MTHARQTIREAAAVLLKASPIKWVSVFETRIPTSRAVLPYLLIFSDGESVENVGQNLAGVYLRSVNITVAGRLRLPGNNDTQTIEDSMDALAEEVETKLTFTTLQASVAALQSLMLNSTEMSVVINEDDAPQYAEVTLSYTARYVTAEGAPGTLI